MKSQDTVLTPDEMLEKTELTNELGSLDFTRTIGDPLYEKFVKATLSRNEFKKTVLTPAEIKEQERIAQKIIEEILEEEKSEIH